MIQFNCPGCQASYTVSDERAGKQGKCPKCQTPFTVPSPTAAAPPPRGPEVDAEPPRKRAPRREEVPDDEDRPRAKRPARPRDDEEREDERPRKERKTKEKLSAVDGALRMIRRGQFLDLLTVLVLLGVGAGAYFGVVAAADNRAREFRAEQDAMNAKYNNEVRDWQRQGGRGPNGQWLPHPVSPPYMWRQTPPRSEYVFQILTDQILFRLLPVLPALLLVTAGLYATIGRFRLAAAVAGSGGGRAFAATAFIAIGRLLLGLAATALVVWLAIDTTTLSAAPDSDGVNYLLALAVAFPVAFYLGVLGEVLSLPGLALAGWFHRTTDRHRGRIGTAAAFYPALAVGWFLLTLALAALAVYAPDTRLIAGAVQGGLFLVIQIVQYIVLTRAYRFPPAKDTVS